MSGGKYNLSFEEYHTVPPAWTPSAVVDRHRKLDGTFDISVTPRVAIDQHGRSDYRAIWYNIADGIRAGDLACVELAVSFIEDRFIVSYSGYARVRLARALAHASLSALQKERLSSHFLKLLEASEKCDEFSEYVKLWPRVITSEDRLRVIETVSNKEPVSQEFRQQLLSKLSENISPTVPNFVRQTNRTSCQTSYLPKRKRYIPVHLRQAKDVADKCGQSYYEALWRRPELIAQEFLIKSASKYTGYDCSRELEELQRQITKADEDLKVAKTNLDVACQQLSILKRGDSNLALHTDASHR